MPLSSIIVRISCCQLLMPAPRSDYGKKIVCLIIKCVFFVFWTKKGVAAWVTLYRYSLINI